MDGTILGKKYDLMNKGGGGGGASSADDVSYDNTDTGLTATNVQDAIDEMVANFGDGVDEVYDACVSAGSTPTSKSPADIATAIGAISGGGAIQLFLKDDTSHHDYPSTVTETFRAPDDGYILYGGINYVSSASLKINNVEKFRGFGSYYFGGNGAVQVNKNDTIVVSYQGNDSQVSIGVFFTPSLTVLS